MAYRAKLYAWGENCVAQHFNYGNLLVKPKEIDLGSNGIKVLAIADDRCCILYQDGSLHTFGRKDDRSLGHDSASTKVSALDALKIVDVFAGGEHMFVVSDKGHVYGWGANHKGQLGWRDETNSIVVNVPKSLKSLHSKKVVQISCGKYHSLGLLRDGAVFAMGDNSYGQLGIGGNSSSSDQPVEIASLRGLPIAQVVAGGWHSFCSTVSGRVFCWGRNDYGQLGLGDRGNRNSPNLLKMLRSYAVTYIAAGDFHSAVLTKDGGVFTFGSSSYGQLGHGSISEFEVNPRKVFELMGSVVTQVACGKLHTIAFVPNSRQVFTCGCGENGQLGVGGVVQCAKVPTIVNGPWNRFEETNSRTMYPGASLYDVKQVGANGNQSFVLLCSDVDDRSLDFRTAPTHRKILTMTISLCNRISQLSDSVPMPSDVANQLECIMSHQSCLNGSFLAEDHHNTSTKYSGLNLMEARLLFSKICQSKNETIEQKVIVCLSENLLPSISSNPPDIEALRIYIHLPELALLHKSANYDRLLFPFVDKLLRLAENPSKILDQWFRTLEPVHFLTPVKLCHDCIITTIKQGLPPDIVKRKVLLLLDYLKKLNDVNNADVPIVDFRKFYIPELNTLIPLESDYQQWARNRGDDFSFCRYPFVFNSKAKTILLQIDSKFQMQAAYSHARGQNMAAFLGLNPGVLESPVIEIIVNRDRLVEDAINTIGTIQNLKRPFTVQFQGEEGQDAGGVRKEFFMMILQDVLNPKYGMFRDYEDSALLWFSDYELETDAMYLLIGTLCGLAVYNSTIVDINFPLALYKKLLGVQPNLSDMKELDPSVGNGLQQLLDFEEEDGKTVEETFYLFFTAPRDVFGDVTQVPLIHDGENVPVTAENRLQYVNAFVNYVFNLSVRLPFEHFARGFHRVCGGEVMNLFRPEELMEMVVGNQNFNWEELEKSTTYKGSYHPKHQIIIWFWEVFHSLSLEEKKEFVLFLTGCHKIPINGLKICIQPISADDNYLPVAHTCFNLLDLPCYTRKDILKAKLKMAIKSQGFHLA